MKDYSLAIIGFGGMANSHLELINEGKWWCGVKNGDFIEHLRVTGAYDICEERQKIAVQKGLYAYNSIEELLSDPKIDIVLIATPNHLHKPFVIKALEAGKNVVTEKPAALNTAELEEMINVSKKSGKVFAVHQNRRWDEDFLAIKNIYNEKKLGEIFRIESRVQHPRGITGGWRSEPQYGGGIILDWGVHILDQALQMVRCKVKKVYGHLTHVTNEVVDDGFYVEITFENGLLFIADVGYSNFYSLPRWYVLGRDGSAWIQDFYTGGKIKQVCGFDQKDFIKIKTKDGSDKLMAPRKEDLIREEDIVIPVPNNRDFYRNFLAVIEGKEELVVSLDSVMRTMKLIEAVFRSDKSGNPESFE